MARKLELDLVAKSNADVVLNRVKTAANNFGADLAKKFTSAFGAMALLDRGLAAVEQGFQFVIASVKKYADIADQAQKSGMDGEDFQRLANAANQAGVSMQTVAKASRELRILMKDAASGNQLAIEKLKALGFTQEQINSGTIKATDVFLQLANAMENAGSDAEKLAILTAIFGDKVSTDLLPLLDTTRQKLRETFGETAVMDNQALRDLDNMIDKLSKFSRLLQFIAASAVYQNLFGRGAGGVASRTIAEGVIPGGGFLVAGAQAAAAGSVGDAKAKGTDTGPAANSAALSNLGTKIGEASMGGGVIGVGASPQIALAQEANATLASMDAKLGEIVNAGISKDPTKPLGRKYPLYSPGLQR
jgi:hypothetical protein